MLKTFRDYYNYDYGDYNYDYDDYFLSRIQSAVRVNPAKDLDGEETILKGLLEDSVVLNREVLQNDDDFQDEYEDFGPLLTQVELFDKDLLPEKIKEKQ